MEHKRKSMGWRRSDASQSSRGPLWLSSLLSLAGNVEVTKLPQRGFGQVYHLRYIASNGRWANLIVVVRTCTPSVGKQARLSFHLANRSVLEYLRLAVAHNIPVVFVGDVLIPGAEGNGTRVQLAIPYRRLAPAIEQYTEAGGGDRVPLNVSVVRNDDSINATLIRAGRRIDVSDCLGLHKVRELLPITTTAGPLPTDHTQFTAQYQLFAVLANVAGATVTMDAADVGRPASQSITSRLGLTPLPNVRTCNSSGLRRADVLAVRGIALDERGFQPGPGPSCVVVAEIEADGSKAQVGRKLIDRLYDAIKLGAPADCIYFYAVVPAQQKAAVKEELDRRLRLLNGGTVPIAGVRVWSTVEIDAAYGCLTGSPSVVGHGLLARMQAPLLDQATMCGGK